MRLFMQCVCVVREEAGRVWYAVRGRDGAWVGKPLGYDAI